MTQWDGQERRSGDPRMFETLSNMDKNLALLAQSSAAHLRAFEAHLTDDKVVHEKVEGIDKKLAWYAGGLAVLLFIVGLVPKFVK